MPNFIFYGWIKLRGVAFTVSAENSEKAIERARLGEFDEYDAAGAETVDWEIRPGSIESAD